MLRVMSKEFEETIAYLSDLCRIELSEDNQKAFGEKLEKILDYIHLIDEVDTTDVPPCRQLVETLVNVMEEDEEKPPMDQRTFLENAPDQVGGMIKIPPVIQFEP
jgi:aspartyl-tRNA(Asn)/glutamyl-tRNA(Gln) amidotransferase subunit C